MWLSEKQSRRLHSLASSVPLVAAFEALGTLFFEQPLLRRREFCKSQEARFAFCDPRGRVAARCGYSWSVTTAERSVTDELDNIRLSSTSLPASGAYFNDPASPDLAWASVAVPWHTPFYDHR